MSLPNGEEAGIIYTKYPTESDLTAHEIEHQSQYQNSENRTETFNQLVEESLMRGKGDVNPYETEGYLEYEAQQVQDMANDLDMELWLWRIKNEFYW